MSVATTRNTGHLKQHDIICGNAQHHQRSQAARPHIVCRHEEQITERSWREYGEQSRLATMDGSERFSARRGLLLTTEVLARQARNLVVLEGCLQEFALGVQDPRVANLQHNIKSYLLQPGNISNGTIR